jgi:hypothetical protein
MAPRIDALRACAAWLSYCLAIGWPRRDLRRLEVLWWSWHDDDGKLRRHAR